MHTRLIWLGLAAVALILVFAALLRLAPGARMKRRLRKTRGRIVSKSERPTVKFSVKPPKE